MKITQHGSLHGRWFIGGTLIALGILFFLMNVGVMENFHIWKFWPVLVMVVGANRFLQPFHRAEGFWIVAIGAICQWSFLRIGGYGWGDTWPAFLIALGIFFMWESFEKESRKNSVQEQLQQNSHP